MTKMKNLNSEIKLPFYALHGSCLQLGTDHKEYCIMVEREVFALIIKYQ